MDHCPCYTCLVFDPDRIDTCRLQCKRLREWEEEFNKECLETINKQSEERNET